jgi:hypothetical protein
MAISIPDVYLVVNKESASEKRMSESELKTLAPAWYKLTDEEVEIALCGSVFENEAVKITPCYLDK